MKRRIALSIALALSVVALLPASSDSTAQAQQRTRFRADTGIVTLAPNQVLRVTVTAVDGADFLTVRFRRMQYAQGACNGGVCKLASVTDLIIDPITVMSGEAAYIDIPQGGFAGVRGIVMSNRRNAKASATIYNTVTGETTSHIIMANTEGDFH